MTFEVFAMIVMALLATAIFMLYRMIGNDQKHYISAFNNINAALNSCMDALDSYGDVIESVVMPLKKKLDTDSTGEQKKELHKSKKQKEYETNIDDVVYAIQCVNLPKKGEEYPTFEDGSPMHPLTWYKWVTVANGHALRVKDFHWDSLDRHYMIYTCVVLDTEHNDTEKIVHVCGKENIFIDYDIALKYLDNRNNKLIDRNIGGWDTLIYNHEGDTDESI
jgi:hypothetical protein